VEDRFLFSWRWHSKRAYHLLDSPCMPRLGRPHFHSPPHSL
jgi:hypothetical protein